MVISEGLLQSFWIIAFINYEYKIMRKSNPLFEIVQIQTNYIKIWGGITLKHKILNLNGSVKNCNYI